MKLKSDQKTTFNIQTSRHTSLGSDHFFQFGPRSIDRRNLSPTDLEIKYRPINVTEVPILIDSER
jgi:hypothetical protein